MRYGQKLSVLYGNARMNADKVIRFYIERQKIEFVNRFPIEQSSVRKIITQFLQYPILIFRLPHQSAVILQEIVFMIARNAIHIRHGKQKFSETDAVRSFVDNIPQHIQLVFVAKFDFFEQSAKQIIIAVDI